MGQAEVVIQEPKLKPAKVDLQIVPSQPDIVEGDEIDWQGILSHVVSLTDKEQVKQVWQDKKDILDVKVPNTDSTLRELLINKVSSFNV